MTKPKILYIMRGVPGSGKSTLASKLVGSENVFAADDYFYHNNEYCFDCKKLPEAHKDCQNRVRNAMKKKAKNIAVANCNLELWEMEPYKKMAKEYGYHVVELLIKSDFSNVHGVPGEKVEEMRKRIQLDI